MRIYLHFKIETRYKDNAQINKLFKTREKNEWNKNNDRCRG